MAISLPDARQLSDEVLQSLRLRPFAAASWATLRSRVAELLGLSGRPSRGGGPPTLIMAWKLSRRPHRPPVAPVVPSTTGKRHGCGRSSTKKAPRRWGMASPLSTPGRRRVDPQGDGIDMPVRTVGEYLERWGSLPRCAPSCQGSGPRGGPPLAGGRRSGDRSGAAE